MPGIVRWTDNCTGHGCFPPRPAATCSPNVFVNNLAVERKTDELEEHCCEGECHSGVYMGERNVYANGLQIQAQGDPIDCGSICDECSINTFIN